MNKTVRLYSVLLYVRDMDTSLAFYRDRLGLMQLGPAEESVVTLNGGGCIVVLHQADRADWPDSIMKVDPGGHAITFEVYNPDAWANRLQGEGVTVIEGPLDQIWGRVVFIKDPDGRVVALARPNRVS